ncbi:MAG: NfeD family protein [Candidatus Thermoplasmatota archaeon]|nr:NfeD family protein [Candidatus Thermoplasmatota archaeon]MBS3790102.1 NfeD family protein [Candidatus Thermoplasmatota archaeon]
MLIVIGIIVLFPISYLIYLYISSPLSPTTTTTTLKGREGFVVKKIKPEDISGKVKVMDRNTIWSATAEEKIEEGKKVRIKEIKGVHVKVEKLD